MKHFLTLLLLIATSTLVSAQKNQRIKGSRTVTIAEREIAQFKNVEIGDNIEVFLLRGASSALEIEADDNLHDVILAEVVAGNLLLSTSSKVRSSKKLSVKITYTGDLETIILKDDVVASTIDKIEIDNLTVKTSQSAKFLGNVISKNFNLMINDRSKLELNLTAEKTIIDLSKNATIKALISSTSMTFDMYQKSSAEVEGDIIDLNLRLENNASFTGKKLTTANCNIIADGYTKSSILVEKAVVIEASGKSEIELLGNPTIEIRKFMDNATLFKK